MLLRQLEDAQEFFDSFKGTLIGAGMTAFSRIVPSRFLSRYRIVALRKTGDLRPLRKRAEIFCLEEEAGGPVQAGDFNSARLLAHPLVERCLGQIKNPKFILPYQSYPELEALALSRGWRLLANPASLRVRVGARAFFQNLCHRLALRSIPGGVYPIQEFFERGYDGWTATLGKRFVVQLPEVVTGGGKGTFFVFSAPVYRHLCRLLKDRTWRGAALRTVLVRKYIGGVPASVALCLTRHGILLSGLQRQLIDLPSCNSLPERGVFCGHAWGLDSWPPFLVKDALEQARKIGRYLGDQGYRGILGVDFLLEEPRERAYPVEINPRLTGAFPMLSLLHMNKGLPPMEAFHLLEFLGIPYETDVDEVNEGYAGPLRGSHLLLFFLSGLKENAFRALDAGRYSCLPDGSVSFAGDGTDYGEIRSEDEFLLVEGPPLFSGNGDCPDPLHRVGRILFPHPAADRTGALTTAAERVTRWSYQMMRGPSEKVREDEFEKR